MLCQKCHRNLATIRYAEVVDGKVADLHLCPECMSQYQQDTATGFEISGAGPELHKAKSSPARQYPETPEQACPSCGMEAMMLLESGRVGCAGCYEFFGNQVESLLEGIHWALRHKGKTAHLDDTRMRLRNDLQTKRALLRSVLQTENYEEAARLRDEIRILEEGLYVSESGAD